MKFKTKLTKLFLLSLLIGGLNSLVAQNYNITSAMDYLQESNYESAKEAIDKAYVHKKTNNSSDMWAARAITYYYIANSPDASIKALDKNAVMISAECFDKFYSGGDKDEDFTEQSNSIVAYSAYSAIMKGVSLAKEKKYDNAWKHYDIALRLMKYDKDAKHLMKQKIELTEFDIYKQMYVTATEAKDLSKQKKMLDLFEKANFNDPLFYKLSSEYYLNTADTTKAKEVLKEGREQFEDDKDLLMSEINLFIATGESQKMLTNINQAIEMEPDNPKYHFIQGVLLDENGKYNEAEASYKKAIEIDEGNYDANFNLASLYINNAKRAKKSDKDFMEQQKIQKENYLKAIPYLKTCNNQSNEDQQEKLKLLRILAKIHLNNEMIAEGRKYKAEYKALKKELESKTKL